MGNSARKGRIVQQAPEEQRNSSTAFEAICRCCQETFCIESIRLFPYGGKQRGYNSFNEESTTKNATQKRFQLQGKGKNVEAAINKKDWKLAIQILIEENSVMVFSDSTCQFCAKVKDLLKSMGIPYFVLELDQIGIMAVLCRKVEVGVTKGIILRYGKSNIIPDVKEWLLEMLDLSSLEKGNVLY